MAKDKRKSIRRPIRYSAWVVLEGDALHGCVMTDISDTGARLDVDETKPIPDQFTLLLSMNGGARRKCRVIWRKPRQIGVSFEGRVSMDPNAGAPPKPEDAAEDAAAEPAKAVAKLDA
jgi:PilZ domain